MILLLFIAIAIIIVIIAIFVYFKFQKNESIKTDIILPKKISQDILVRLAMLEKKLFANSFIRQMILEVTAKRKKELVFYYFNTIDKIHIIVTYRNRKFNYFIFSRLFNNKLLVTSSCVDCIVDTRNIIITSYGSSSVDKVLEHKTYRRSLNQAIIKDKLSYEEVSDIYENFTTINR